MRYLVCLMLCFNICAYGQVENHLYSTERMLLGTSPADTAAIGGLIEKARALTDRHPDSAVALCDDLLLKSRLVGYPAGMIRTLLTQGKAYALMGKYREAMEAWRSGITTIYTYREGYTALASFYSNIAVLYAFKGSSDQALTNLYRALYFVKAFAPDGNQVAAVYNNISSVLLQIPGIPPEGPHYYLNLAAAVALEKKDDKMLAGIWNNKGTFYARKQQWEKAKAYFDSALAIATPLGLAEIRYSALLSIGGAYLTQNKTAEALKYLYEAKALSANAPINPFYQIITEISLAEVFTRAKDYNQAINYLLTARDLAERLGLHTEKPQIYETLSRMYAQLGQYQQSLKYHQWYTQIKDSLFRQQGLNHAREMDVKYRTAQKEKEITAARLTITQQENRMHLKNILLWAGFSGLILLVALLFFAYKNNRQKQKIMLKERSIADLKAMMKGEEKERMRIAGELHDGIGGMITAIKLNFNALATTCPPTETKQVNNITQMLQAASSEVRTIAQNLMPDIVIQFGLQKALQTYCSAIAGQPDGIDIDLKLFGDLHFSDQSTELMLYRICQELIQNVIKHAQAGKMEIQMMEYEGKVNVTVEDNGVGFDTDAVYGGMGLRNLRSRIQTLQGFLSITSVEGKGTTVHMEFDKFNLE